MTFAYGKGPQWQMHEQQARFLMTAREVESCHHVHGIFPDSGELRITGTHNAC